MDGPTGDEHEPGGSSTPAHPIDEVATKLAAIVDWARANRSRVGYFAAIYRKVTLWVKAAIEAGEFEDAGRMTDLVVLFAQRYIDAFEQFRAGRRPTEAWDVSLSAARGWRPIVLQQLLTGMNAHINLDLGVAAATVCPGTKLSSLHRDFNTINDILGTMIDQFVDDVAEVSPWTGLLDRLGGRGNDVLIEFSIIKARDGAWMLATELASIDQSEWEAPTAARDRWTARFGEFLLSPGWMLSVGLLLIRVRESNNVTRVIDVLSGE
jgi:hypothetical protein